MIAGGGLLNLFVSEAVDKVVVYHSDRLHVRINDCRTHKAESPLLQILTEGV